MVLYKIGLHPSPVDDNQDVSQNSQTIGENTFQTDPNIIVKCVIFFVKLCIYIYTYNRTYIPIIPIIPFTDEFLCKWGIPSGIPST